jgi:hypothetical protein
MPLLQLRPILWINVFELLLGVVLIFSVPVFAEATTPIPASYFGMHLHRASAPTPTAWPTVPVDSWRLWDAAVSWVNLEPERGKWDFSKLDQLVALGEKHNVELLLTLGLTPRWAATRPGDYSAYGPGYSSEPENIEDWRTYVAKVATRYQGRISAYEIWNEPNLKAFYSGTPEKMVELAFEAHRILKEIDPAVIVVSPSSTGGASYHGPAWLDEYLQAGGGRYADVIGYHFYVSSDPPEAMLPLIAEVQRVMAAHGIGDKPLWNTEAGWNIANRQKSPDGSGPAGGLDEQTASAYVARALLLNLSAGVERFYWYAWDNYLMGLIEPDGKTLKAPALAYGEVFRWLVDAQLLGCSQEPDGNWVCRLKRDGGEARIVWRTSGMDEWTLPVEWKRAVGSDLTGRRWKVSGRAVIVGTSPVLLEPDP